MWLVCLDCRLRGNDGPGRLVLSCSPSPLIPLPSRERGFCRLDGLVVCLALWFPAYAGMTVMDADVTGRDRRNTTGFAKVSVRDIPTVDSMQSLSRVTTG